MRLWNALGGEDEPWCELPVRLGSAGRRIGDRTDMEWEERIHEYRQTSANATTN